RRVSAMAGRAPPLILLANKRRMSTKVWRERYSVGFFRGRLSERDCHRKGGAMFSIPGICITQDSQSNALARLERPFFAENTACQFNRARAFAGPILSTAAIPPDAASASPIR